jgi:hypothetical protein
VRADDDQSKREPAGEAVAEDEASDATEALLELVVTPPAQASRTGVVVAEVTRAEPGVLEVRLPGVDAVQARALATAGDLVTGNEVLVVCEGGDPARPIVLGVVTDPNAALASAVADASAPAEQSDTGVSVSVDGKRMVLEAQEEMVLRCGEASITLTRAGKVLIRGAYLSSRSSGAHRIRGATVEIN